MKIKDILAVLGEELKDELYENLNNVGFANLTLDSDIPQKIVKKLEKKYGKEIKLSTKTKKIKEEASPKKPTKREDTG